VADLLPEFRRRVGALGLLPKRGRLLVAVSGGVDSMVLLDLLARALPDAPHRLVVAHFNHQLRGRSSEADERLVRRAAAALGLRCVVGRAGRRLSRGGDSIEMWAREQRHRFLAQAAKGLRCAAIVTAHHSDDQVELFFIRLLRGASPGGLAGMKAVAPSPWSGAIQIVRPLLTFSRREIEAHASARGLVYREDESNCSLRFLRNRVRHELIPLLRRRYQAGVERVVLRAQDQITAEAELVHDLASRWLASRRRARFERLPVAVQRAVVERQLPALGAGPEFGLIESLRLHAGQAVAVSPRLRLWRTAAGVIERAPATKAERFAAGAVSLSLARRSAVEFAGAVFRWEIIPARGWRRRLARKPAGEEWFDADHVGARVVLRHWRRGDRFQPIGMARPVKLQDWFVNRKVPAVRRRSLVVAQAADGVLWWVENGRISEAFKLTSASRRVLRWRWARPERPVATESQE
jgi:tRNA(Ile)-lysidine synthase